jgi:hypothetical protein
MSGVETATRALTVEEFSAVHRNSLRGFAKVVLPSGMILIDVTINVTKDQPWASPPSKPMLTREGIALRDENGKIKYSPCVTFSSKQHRDRFSESVIAALLARFPGALA